MAQTFTVFVSGTTLFSNNFFDKVEENFTAIRSKWSGSSAPSSPKTYQSWFDTSGATAVWKIYNGSSWVNAETFLSNYQDVSGEVEDARGTASDLDARLSIALNDDGTLKTTTSSSVWVEETNSVSYSDSSTFVVSGADVTAVYVAGRALKLTQTSDDFVYVESSSFGGADTTVNIYGGSVDSGLSKVEYGHSTYAAPAVVGGFSVPVISSGDADKMFVVQDDESGYELQSPSDVRTNIGVPYATGSEVATGTEAAKVVTPDALADFLQYEHIWIPAAAMTPRETNGPKTVTNEYATNDHTIDVMAFDGSTEEFATFPFVMPSTWDRGTIKFKAYWAPGDSAASASDTVEWELSAVAVGDDGAIDTATGTGQVISDTVLAGVEGDLHISGASPAITVGGSPALGDILIFTVSRNVSGTDDMTEDAWLFGIVLEIKHDNTVSAW
jgi:hypothetical protein